MEVPMAFLVAIFFAVSIYLFLSRHIIRILLGAAILSNAVNLLIFTSGRLTREIPPILPAGGATEGIVTANPLPQALILTAIVIAFSFFAFLLVLSYRAYQELGTDDTNEMRFAEPEEQKLPPLGY
ncbi:Na+/H+ antiporter subunit C [Hoeflea poritis]|uniref:Na+/H+ antiporter subunit C n=1 Tax=Hoeflea poritis TaxID=2993659 RepID=A0ABT4VTW2_9HYPH|nr:Na+/H+ antiporter subunit C [Hoeflea poritis]MDA4848151.1 Na+/H+ antiporter subunit C [Hoeflea poritis]